MERSSACEDLRGMKIDSENHMTNRPCKGPVRARLLGPTDPSDYAGPAGFPQARPSNWWDAPTAPDPGAGYTQVDP